MVRRLARIARYSTALGKFETVDEYFQRTAYTANGPTTRPTNTVRPIYSKRLPPGRSIRFRVGRGTFVAMRNWERSGPGDNGCCLWIDHGGAEALGEEGLDGLADRVERVLEDTSNNDPAIDAVPRTTRRRLLDAFGAALAGATTGGHPCQVWGQSVQLRAS